MTDKEKIKVQRWWMEQLRAMTRKIMADEEKRQEKVRKKTAEAFGDLAIERREDIDDLYGYGVITDRQREKLINMFEKENEPDEIYKAKIDLLQDAYEEAHRVMLNLGQEV